VMASSSTAMPDSLLISMLIGHRYAQLDSTPEAGAGSDQMLSSYLE
jgi:hypothetical protein